MHPDYCRDKGIHIVFDREVHNLIVNDALFNQWHKGRTRSLNDVEFLVVHVNHVFVRMGSDGNLRSDHADFILDAPVSADVSRGRFNDADDRSLRESLLQIIDAGSADRIAGDDDHLHI